MAAVPFGLFARIVIGQALDYWIDHGGLGIFDSSGTVTVLTGKKTTLVFERLSEVPSSTRDIIETSAYWLLTDTGDFSVAWDDTGYAATEAALEDWWTAAKAYYGTSLTFVEIRWYEAGPDVTLPNAAFRVTPVGVAGTVASSSLPPQVSTTMTLETASRRHWGRLYLPNPQASLLAGAGTTDGRWSHSAVDAFVGDWTDAVKTLATDVGIVQAVWSKVSGTFLSIVSFEVDDIPDIQRRRRFATVGYRNTVDA
jgi:hypothetical protein